MTDLLDPAPQDSVGHWARRLDAHLAPQTRERLAKLIALIDADHQLNYADAYAALFPGSLGDPAAKTRADKSFQKLRETLRTVAAEQGITLELRVDQRRKASPAERKLWFVTADDSDERLSGFSERAVAGLPAPPGGVLAEQYAAVQSETPALAALAVYAEQDAKEAHAIVGALQTHCDAHGAGLRLHDWHAIETGEHVATARRRLADQARLVVPLVSPALIADLKQARLTIPDDRPLVPLRRKQVQPDSLTGTCLHGLGLFKDGDGKAWYGRKGPQQAAWIEGAANALLRRLARANTNPATDLDLYERLLDTADFRRTGIDPRHFVHPLATRAAGAEGEPALPRLLAWLQDPVEDVFCALFGELGMGKTTLCQQLTLEVLDRRREGEPLPLPVYLDLRAINAMPWDWQAGAPALDAMLTHLIDANFNLPVAEQRPDAAQIKRLVQQRGGLVIFDGLDEVMNRLTPHQCRQFIAQLWSILPPALWQRPRAAAPGWRRPAGVGRLLMSCRSHFFQTLKDQLGFFDGEQRAAVTAKDYLWLTLLPFGGEQVETYFRQVFADDPDRAERVIAMLDQVHDLRELGSRPYNLRLIQGQVDRLEAKQRAGERVDIADLYEGMVEQWLRRDDPKHRLKREHKLLLMERLARRLWGTGQSSLPYQDLEDWLVDQLLADPRWERIEYRAYLNRDNGPAVLQEDLRNATFIVREGEDRFRFAHTSILEFFLARALHRALIDAATDPAALAAWNLPTPSPETLDFLGCLIAARDTDACLAGLAAIRARYRPRISELALAYGLYAFAHGHPGDSLAGFQLQGAELRFQRWQGRPERPLDLRGADLTGATLDGGEFTDCDLSDARLDGADLSRSVLDRCRLDRVQAAGVDLTGATVHACSAVEIRLEAPRLYHTYWLGQLPPTLAENVELAPPDLFVDTRTLVTSAARAATVAGHVLGLSTILCAPDGAWVASAAADGTVCLWDPLSGRELHRLLGHQNQVLALAVAPDGAWLASAGDDGLVRLWDPLGGRELHRLCGHRGRVLALAVAPNDAWLASAGGDGTVRLWDTLSGRELHRLTGHRSAVRALAVAPSGDWLASAADDGTVHLWNPIVGRELHRLTGHQSGARALAVAPDGAWLASAGSDGMVRLWDPLSGRQLHRLSGHQGWVGTLAVAPNSAWLASAGSDGMVRLWDPVGGRELRRLSGHQTWLQALTVASDGTWLAAAAGNGTVHLWDPLNGRELHQLSVDRNLVLALAVGLGGGWLASAGVNGTVCIWDPRDGRELHRLSVHQNVVLALAVDPDGAWLASAATDGTVRLWDLRCGCELHRLCGHQDWVRALAVAPDGTWLATGGDEHVVRLWDPLGGRELHRLSSQNRVSALAVAPDGAWLASAGDDGTVLLWDPLGGRQLHRLSGHGRWVNALAVAPDGGWLASGGDDGTVRLWDPLSGHGLHRISSHEEGVEALAVAPDGTWLASGGDDGTVRLWNPLGGLKVYRRYGDQNRVWALAVAPAGTWLASARDDGTVLLWDPLRRCELHRLCGHPGGVLALAAAPDGTWLASAGADGTIRRWRLDTGTAPPYCDLMIELLPQGNWVTWHDPDGPERRWVHWSPGAWRWLGWHAPLPDGKHWMHYPMDAFVAPEPVQDTP